MYIDNSCEKKICIDRDSRKMSVVMTREYIFHHTPPAFPENSSQRQCGTGINPNHRSGPTHIKAPADLLEETSRHKQQRDQKDQDFRKTSPARERSKETRNTKTSGDGVAID
jgi:hypothetical protein